MLRFSFNDNINVEPNTFTLNEGIVETIASAAKGMDNSEKSMFYIDYNGKFYFIVSNGFDLEQFEGTSGFLVTESVPLDIDNRIGIGIHGLSRIGCRLSQNLTEEEYARFSAALNFDNLRMRVNTYFPRTMEFQRSFLIDGYHCFSIYDYISYKKGVETTSQERLVRNFVMQFKNGECTEIAARLLYLAIEKESEIPRKNNNVVILPIPASSAEVNNLRFGSFCKELARLMEVTNGFNMVEVTTNRKEGDLRKDIPITSLMRLKPGTNLTGKSLVIVDDGISSGRGFIKMASFLRSSGAESVLGVFIAKTM